MHAPGLATLSTVLRVQVYQYPMLASLRAPAGAPPLLSKEEIDTLFSNVKHIYELNSQVCASSNVAWDVRVRCTRRCTQFLRDLRERFRQYAPPPPPAATSSSEPTAQQAGPQQPQEQPAPPAPEPVAAALPVEPLQPVAGAPSAEPLQSAEQQPRQAEPPAADAAVAAAAAAPAVAAAVDVVLPAAGGPAQPDSVGSGVGAIPPPLASVPAAAVAVAEGEVPLVPVGDLLLSYAPFFKARGARGAC